MTGAERRPARSWIALVTDDFTPAAGPPRADDDWLPEDEGRGPADDWTPEEEPKAPLVADGPIGWAGYDASRARAAERTGTDESVLHGTARIGGHPCVLVVFEFGFLGGSLGRAAGDRLVAAFRTAAERRLPLVSLVATGGSRMQEGMIALTQLQRVAAASVRLRAAGVPHLAVLRDPTTGGGWATLGAAADLVLALPTAQVAFAGSRVRPAHADPAAYTAEDQHAHGHVDALVAPEQLRETLAQWLRLLSPRPGPAAPDDAGEARVAGPAPAPPPPALRDLPLPPTGWDAVLRAREAGRPRAGAYLDAYFETRAAISGDRAGGVDAGVECGFGVRRGGQVVAYAAQSGGATRPAGFRTVARLIGMADRLGIPVLTLIDTPGAANDAEAERAGAGPAIAEVFTAIAGARTPVTSLLVGEGGSGGALALAAPGSTWVTPDGYFSVIAPELAAQILKRTPDQVPETACQLRLRPQDLVDLGVARGIVGPGQTPGQHEAPSR
ncbi:carboxyl transferase domain-containing protein [Streptomyces sp. NPDC101160]|uniref:carboxyl transferase domain-containing protein n=1 Tax=Streptomyces sp. NPDC101160 TaxID=3366118 RepID=UPI00382A662B